MPKPKNDSVVSASTAAATPTVASTMSSDEMLGMMWRTTIVGPGTPMYFAAVTYSRSRSDIVRLRTTRAVSIQPSRVSSTISSQMLLPGLTLRSSTAMIMNDGITSSRSITHSEMRSNQPPK